MSHFPAALDKGYRVLEAANGEEAVRVVKGHAGEEIHALVTDIVMPRMGGIELAERFKAGRQNARAIFMSGYTDKAVFDYAAPEPGVAFLQKPFLSEALTLKLRELLDDQKLVPRVKAPEAKAQRVSRAAKPSGP
jgi:CheY-like chemotaxis protein